MSEKKRVEHLVSAGGVVCRRQDGKIEVLLCGRNSPVMWALPKGTPDPEESLEQTALREVREETGLEVDIMASLGSIEYWFMRSQDQVRCHKTVHFYLMSPKGGSIAEHDPEFDTVKWFSNGDVLGMLTYPSEAKVVEKALASLKGETSRQ